MNGGLGMSLVGYVKVPARENEAKAAIHTWMMSASGTTEQRPRVLVGPNGSRYGDELLDHVGIYHSGACRGQGQLLGPSKPRLESLIGFKRRGSLCTWSTFALLALASERRKRGHARQVESGDT